MQVFNMELVRRAALFTNRTAIISYNHAYSYADLLEGSEKIAQYLLNGDLDLYESRIAFLIDPSFLYTAIQWGIWRAGGVAVPLCNTHPLPAIHHVLEDTSAKIVITDENYAPFLKPLLLSSKIKLVLVEEIESEFHSCPLPEIGDSRRAMILYTSGTTNKPKGVVTTHANINFQIQTLVEAWHWKISDQILNVLPLHHVHGIINAMCCPLWVGACCEFLPKFDAQKVWQIFSEGHVNVFMAVPTIYFKLIQQWETADPETREMWAASCKGFRLMVSGSAALPVAVLERWQSISGHILLERYGMTEIGMAISNPYLGERRPGHVGLPLPGVRIRLFDNQLVEEEQRPGEIQVQGPNVFLEYWNNLKATEDSFTEDGWFKTGDIAEMQNGYYKILGRDSVDIIKSGGYKISALEIEDILLQLPDIRECAVVGIPDDEWGELVTAFLVVNQQKEETFVEGIKQKLKQTLPAYKVPRSFKILDQLPRNALGKVTKNELKKR